ncbi:pantetheine-phosphate adenylyltransferase [Halanaerobium praevalens DSM 2228]|uniref:Pantetheine-phosphate adenylyltransferase n=1 Tax=Halanaerobium praevalens (strain ATCC 33744 / DSM 2228 / GSL) TaxID=572479 RepID=E3DM07_HALPG|nr:pantetheine-phosphate adenylyltransferase [Halanaerobium praevalens DSM 2228]
MIKNVYLVKYDPITIVQLNIIRRANKFVNKLIISIYINENINFCFSPLERKNTIKKVAKEVSCEYYDGLLISFMKTFNSNLN